MSLDSVQSVPSSFLKYTYRSNNGDYKANNDDLKINTSYVGETGKVNPEDKYIVYHQGRSESINPYAEKDVFSNIEELEARKSGKTNYTSGAVKQTVATNQKGSAWEGFVTPENNGTGDLIPNLDKEGLITLAFA